jgi:hypothetical protein
MFVLKQVDGQCIHVLIDKRFTPNWCCYIKTHHDPLGYLPGKHQVSEKDKKADKCFNRL